MTVAGQLVGAEHAGCHTQHGGQRIDQRTAFTVQIEQGRAQGCTRHTGGKALHHTRPEQSLRILCMGEHQHGDRLQSQGGKNDGAPAQVIGQCAHGEQGDEQTEGIDREDQGQHARGKAPGLLVEAIQGRGSAGCRQKAGQGQGDSSHIAGAGHRSQGYRGCGHGKAGSATIKANFLRLRILR